MMPFNFFNTSSSFQEYINNILVENLDSFVIIYWNAILIYIDKVDYVDTVW